MFLAALDHVFDFFSFLLLVDADHILKKLFTLFVCLFLTVPCLTPVEFMCLFVLVCIAFDTCSSRETNTNLSHYVYHHPFVFIKHPLGHEVILPVEVRLPCHGGH